MSNKRKCSLFTLAAILAAGITDARAAELAAIHLPAPNQSGGKPLMQALKTRQTRREFSPRQLSPQMLSDLLWAGFGINRPANGHRTAPSAMNMQEIDVYAATRTGLYLYDARQHRLNPMVAADLRAQTTGQAALQRAPLALIFVADHRRMSKAPAADREFYAAFDAGCIVQNIYLFCASEGLATVVHELNRPPLAQAMKLRPEQKIIMAQAVGYAPEP